MIRGIRRPAAVPRGHHRSDFPEGKHERWRPRPRPEPAGGADRARTGDPLVANQVLSQLSYSPEVADGGPKWI
jgi:hypothetical protein